MLLLFAFIASAFATQFEDFEDSDRYTSELLDELDEGLLSNLKCSLCKNLVVKAEEFVTTKGAEGVREYLKTKVCPDTVIIKDVCHNLVDTLINKVIDLIVEKAEPTVVCKKLKMC